MRFHVLVLLTLCILLATASTAEVSHLDANFAKRQLRVANKLNTDFASEDRGVLSSIIEWAQLTYWIQIGKSDDSVKQALGMGGLTEIRLEEHPNFEYFQKFLYKAEGHKMDNWVSDDIATQTVWKKLGLEKMAQRENSDAYRMYVRYATKYDDEIWRNKNSIFEPAIYYGGSSEMIAKVQIWVKAERPK